MKVEQPGTIRAKCGKDCRKDSGMLLGKSRWAARRGCLNDCEARRFGGPTVGTAPIATGASCRKT